MRRDRIGTRDEAPFDMTDSRQHTRHWFLPAAGLGGVLIIFAVVVAAGTLTLRSRLRAQALHQEASSLEGLVLMQLDAQSADINASELAGTEVSAFDAVLESSRMRGVIAVRLFDGTGTLISCLPGTAVDAHLSQDLAARASQRGEACARLYPDAKLADHLGTEGLAAGEKRAALLEVVVPVPQTSTDAGLSIAQYWMNGAPLETSFKAMDAQLVRQAALAYLAGSAAIVLCLAWVYRRLRAAERRLEERSMDLAKANAELVFAAKTSAVGAISAHLVHGLRNPVAGIDGYLADAAAGGDAAGDGEALREARETTRRISGLLRQVSTILSDEAGTSGTEPCGLRDLIDQLHGEAAPRAARAGVTLDCAVSGDARVSVRIASLCRLALKNVVDNAIDATPRGKRVGVAARSLSDGRIEVDITDEGPGFAPSERDRIFQPRRSTKPGGSGLGLAISWHLVRHAGGELRIEKTNSSGSQFRLTFPSILKNDSP